MAAAPLMSIPAVVVFSSFERQLVKGVTKGAVKG